MCTLLDIISKLNALIFEMDVIPNIQSSIHVLVTYINLKFSTILTNIVDSIIILHAIHYFNHNEDPKKFFSSNRSSLHTKNKEILE
jgi:hypothetical protein